MAMADPKPTFSYVVSKLRNQHPDLAYIHVVEPRSQGTEVLESDSVPKGHDNDFIREIWSPRPLLSAGGYTRELALEAAEKKGDIIAFSRAFIANVSIVLRFCGTMLMYHLSSLIFLTASRKTSLSTRVTEARTIRRSCTAPRDTQIIPLPLVRPARVGSE